MERWEKKAVSWFREWVRVSLLFVMICCIAEESKKGETVVGSKRFSSLFLSFSPSSHLCFPVAKTHLTTKQVS